VFRPHRRVVFDMQGNGKFDGCAVDACPGPFVPPGDLPGGGKWDKQNTKLRSVWMLGQDGRTKCALRSGLARSYIGCVGFVRKD